MLMIHFDAMIKLRFWQYTTCAASKCIISAKSAKFCAVSLENHGWNGAQCVKKFHDQYYFELARCNYRMSFFFKKHLKPEYKTQGEIQQKV